jgi:glutathione S-transferase
MLVPSLQHNGVKVWDTLAIGEYLNEIKPKAGCCRPMPRRARIAAPSAARCIRALRRCAARCR